MQQKIRYTLLIEAESIEKMKSWIEHNNIHYIFNSSLKNYREQLDNNDRYINYYASIGTPNEIFLELENYLELKEEDKQKFINKKKSKSI